VLVAFDYVTISIFLGYTLEIDLILLILASYLGESTNFKFFFGFSRLYFY